MQSLFSAASGLSAQQRRLETISANIANADTSGFKATRTDFKDALYTTMVNPVNADGAAANLLAGSGVLLGATAIDMSQGAAVRTDQALDFAIEGEGFFQVQTDAGEILYTRSGCFAPALIDGEIYLATQEGYFVLDANGQRIGLPADTGGLRVSAGGVLMTADQNYGALGIMSFTNPQGLEPAGGAYFRTTENSGQPEPDLESAVIQGSLERSNVDMARELTMLIRAQRAYSLASRARTTTDDMMGLADTIHS
jgi:flagellar basal-body rod protein FlgG